MHFVVHCIYQTFKFNNNVKNAGIFCCTAVRKLRGLLFSYRKVFSGFRGKKKHQNIENNFRHQKSNQKALLKLILVYKKDI